MKAPQPLQPRAWKKQVRHKSALQRAKQLRPVILGDGLVAMIQPPQLKLLHRVRLLLVLRALQPRVHQNFSLR